MTPALRVDSGVIVLCHLVWCEYVFMDVLRGGLSLTAAQLSCEALVQARAVE